MGSLSDALEIELLDHILQPGAFTVPTDIYLALSTADPLDDGSGIAEPGGNGYARVVCNTWDAAASRAIANTGAITYPEATGSWGTVTHFAIFDAITGGNFLAHGSLSVSKAIGAGDNPAFAAGDVDISFNAAGLSDYLANALLDHVFKTSAHAPSVDMYVCLTNSATADADTGTTLQAKEPTGVGSYARKNHNVYDAAAGGASENTGAITFVTATAAWGTITHAALTDHLTAGNMLLHFALDASKAIGTGDIAEFADGALDITLN